MSKFSVIKRIIMIGLLGVLVYTTVRYGDVIKSYLVAFVPVSESSVQGISTQKASEVTGKLQGDIGSGFDQIQQQALQISVGDLVSGFSRLQKIPQDFHAVQDYVKGQIENVVESRK